MGCRVRGDSMITGGDPICIGNLLVSLANHGSDGRSMITVQDAAMPDSEIWDFAVPADGFHLLMWNEIRRLREVAWRLTSSP